MMAEAGAPVSEGFAELQADHAAKGRTAMFVSEGGRVIGLVTVSDPVKPNARQAVETLRADGIEVVMATGDAKATAEAVGQAVGVSRIEAGMTPESKHELVLALRRQGKIVAFAGDGINDAPALARADVGIAIGTGTDIAIESADVVLMSGDLRGVANAIALSRATLRNVRQNLAWAFGYNVVLIPVAAGALYPVAGIQLSPKIAGLAMALSSVSVVSNALRLNAFRPLAPVSVEARP